MVANFTKATQADQPSLLTHEEVSEFKLTRHWHNRLEFVSTKMIHSRTFPTFLFVISLAQVSASIYVANWLSFHPFECKIRNLRETVEDGDVGKQ